MIPGPFTNCYKKSYFARPFPLSFALSRFRSKKIIIIENNNIKILCIEYDRSTAATATTIIIENRSYNNNNNNSKIILNNRRTLYRVVVGRLWCCYIVYNRSSMMFIVGRRWRRADAFFSAHNVFCQRKYALKPPPPQLSSSRRLHRVPEVIEPPVDCRCRRGASGSRRAFRTRHNIIS